MIKILVAFSFFLTPVLANEGYGDLERSINLNIEKKAQVDLELNKADDSVKQLETHLKEKRKILSQRTRAMAYIQNFKWGQLLTSDDPITLERNLKIISRLNKYDLALFKEYRESLKSLAKGRKDLVAFKTDLDGILKDLITQEKKLQEEEKIRSERMALENRKTLLHYKGRMPRPVDGQISLAYGSHRDEQNQFAFLNRGLLFETKPQSQVVSVGPGKVIFRDQLPHWGETLIIEHDDGYYSVYAGVKSAIEKATAKENVQMHDVIAQAKGHEFYFELRHYDNPINPKTWLKE